VKKSRAAIPLAKWKIEAPTTMVLSTSKNAAAFGSGGTVSARSGLPVLDAGSATRSAYRRQVSAPEPAGYRHGSGGGLDVA